MLIAGPLTLLPGGLVRSSSYVADLQNKLDSVVKEAWRSAAKQEMKFNGKK